MTLHRSMWKAAVLAGIAGVLMFAGGALGAAITITTQPADKTVKEGAITSADKLSVVAESDDNTSTLSYQWKSAAAADKSGAVNVSGANSENFEVPVALTEGTYYYFVTINGTASEPEVSSDVATVTVEPEDDGDDTWSLSGCTNVTISTDAMFKTCFDALVADYMTEGNPLAVFVKDVTPNWVVGNTVTTVTRDQAAKFAADKLAEAQVWWTVDEAARAIKFASTYVPNFLTADEVWTAPVAGTTAKPSGTDGTFAFNLAVKTGTTVIKLPFGSDPVRPVTVTARAVKAFTAPEIVVTGPVEDNKLLVVNTISTRDVFTVGAVIGGVTPTGSMDNTLEFRWFKMAGATYATTDPAAAGSVWASASANGHIYKIPENITVGTHKFYARVRTTRKASDGVTDSVAMQRSVFRTVEVLPRPVISGTPAVAFAVNSCGDGTQACTAPVPDGAAGSSSQVQGAVKGTLTVSGASISQGTLTYQWYYNATNTNLGGVQVLDDDNNAATGQDFKIPTSLQTGYYYYFCEVRADDVKAAPVRSVPMLFTVTPQQLPVGKTVTGLSNTNIVQVSNGSADYSRTGTLRLTVSLTASAALVSPTVANPAGGNLSFSVVRIIYQNQADGAIRAFDADGIAADAETNPGDGSIAEPWPLTEHKVIAAGTYNVTVVVRSTNDEGTIREGSRTVTFTVNPKQIGSINTKTVLPATVSYDGKTKVPTISLIDGTGANAYPLVAGLSTNATGDYVRTDGDLTNAGTASITFVGRNNYAGSLVLSFTITKKEIRFDSIATKAATVATAGGVTQPVWLGKTYDGTNVVDASRLNAINVKFSGLVNDNDLSNGFGYTVTALSYDAANAGARVVNGSVRLDTSTATGSSLGRNYAFVGGSATSSFAVSGVTIAKKDPVAEDFDFTIPTNRFFTGQPQGIGTVSWKSAYTSTGDTRTVYYDAGDGLGAVSTLPTGKAADETDYAVTLNVSGSNNFLDKTGISLGTFKILKPKAVTVAVTNLTASDDHKADPNAYIGDPFTLRTVVTRPDSGGIKKTDGTDSLLYKGGTLTYLWYIDTASTSRWDTLKVGGAAVKTATFTTTYTAADTLVSNLRKYKVDVTWTYPAVQAPVTTTSTAVTVTINKERVDIAAAVVNVTAPAGGFVYNGTTQTPAVVSVKLGAAALTWAADGSADFTYDVFGEEAGTGVVSVTGTGPYKGRASGTFEIAKKLTTEAGLKYNPASTSVAYNGAAQPITVSPVIGDGLGAVTIKYLDISDEDNPVTLTAAPKNAGAYKTLISIAEGKNYTELEEFERNYTITKRFVEKADFNYTMPRAGAAPTAVTATLKNPMGYTGTLTTLYRNDAGTDLTAVPTTEGKYAVRVRVSGDDNFGMVVVTLDTLKIDENGKVGVKTSDREVPKSVETNVAAVAPVKVVASGFTAGPSPVKTGSAIKFFSAKAVKSGTLYIFDANGNSVAKVSAKSASGEIGSWNLKDRKGTAVSEGTYVVKGALVGKDGTKEKVSFPFSVVK